MPQIKDTYWLHNGQHYATKFNHLANGLVEVTHYRHGGSYRHQLVGLDGAAETLRGLEAEGYV